MVGHDSGAGSSRVRPPVHSAGSLNAEPKSATRQGSGMNFLSTKAPASLRSEKTLAEILPPSSRSTSRWPTRAGRPARPSAADR